MSCMGKGGERGQERESRECERRDRHAGGEIHRIMKGRRKRKLRGMKMNGEGNETKKGIERKTQKKIKRNV